MSKNIFNNIKLDGKHLQFKVKDVDLSIVNSLRRIILSEIPSIALEFDPVADENPDINIKVNNSALHNEYLSHRISLLPMCFDKEVIESDFDKDDYLFQLKIKNTSAATINVTTHDIKIYNKKGELYPVNVHETIFPKNEITKDYVLITKLRPNVYNPDSGEEIDLEFRGSKNIAKTHARWSTVSCCAFSNTVDEVAAENALKELLAKTDENHKKAVSNKFITLDKFRYFVKNKYGEASEFDFQIESECGLSPLYIFEKAIDVFKNKYVNLNKQLKENKITIKRIHTKEYLYDVIIVDEDYTLLNTMQSLIYNNEIRTKKNGLLEYIGYYQPHPLDSKMILKIKLKDDTDVSEFLVKCNEQIIQHIEELEQKWLELSK